MQRSLRVTAGVSAAAAGLLASTVLAGAATFTIDPIMKNDLKLKTQPSPQLVMGGSSFDAPIVQDAETHWNSDNGKTAFSTYNSTKSGTGRANVISGAYNIGFSDFPMNIAGNKDVGPGSPNPKLSTANFVQIPVALGGVAIIYHLGAGVSGQEAALIQKYGLTLNGPVLGQIFAGKITNWDSAAIGNLNKKLWISGKDALPNLTIQVASRTSGSGTTFMFQDYLSLVDKKDFPAPTAAAFTAAFSTFANSAALDAGVHATNGAIGYVEYGYAIANKSATANLVNASGAVVKLSGAGIVSAAKIGLGLILKSKGGFNTTKLAGFEVNNEKGAGVYPIAGFSFAIVYKAQTNLNAAIAEVKFLDFLSHQGGGGTAAKTFGQDLANADGYAPLPTQVQNLARKLLLQVTVNKKVVLNATD
jgi:phosphate transport system substrate-binding protein